ncbi:hypothetical protein BJV74DRAFT_715230, partial [Russula compacta]
WATRFLPTLYMCLACSSDPFVLDPDLVKFIQGVVDITHPESNYQVRANDKLFTKVSHSLRFFKREEYHKKPKAISKYALWATRGNGPAIFGKPTPITCTVKKGANGYIVSRPALFLFLSITNNIF